MISRSFHLKEEACFSDVKDMYIFFATRKKNNGSSIGNWHLKERIENADGIACLVFSLNAVQVTTVELRGIWRISCSMHVFKTTCSGLLWLVFGCLLQGENCQS